MSSRFLKGLFTVTLVCLIRLFPSGLFFKRGGLAAYAPPHQCIGLEKQIWSQNFNLQSFDFIPQPGCEEIEFLLNYTANAHKLHLKFITTWKIAGCKTDCESDNFPAISTAGAKGTQFIETGAAPKFPGLSMTPLTMAEKPAYP